MFKVMMFVSSLLPMYACLLLKYNSYMEKPVSFIIACVLTAAGILATLYVFARAKSEKRAEVKEVKILQPVREISANYLMAYVLPFIVFDFDKHSDIFIFFIVYGLLMLLYVKYNLTYFNLVLEICGYIVCRALIEGQSEEALLILKNLKHQEKKHLMIEKIGNGLYIHIQKKKNN